MPSTNQRRVTWYSSLSASYARTRACATSAWLLAARNTRLPRTQWPSTLAGAICLGSATDRRVDLPKNRRLAEIQQGSSPPGTVPTAGSCILINCCKAIVWTILDSRFRTQQSGGHCLGIIHSMVDFQPSRDCFSSFAQPRCDTLNPEGPVPPVVLMSHYQDLTPNS